MGVCGSNVLFHGRLALRRFFWAFVASLPSSMCVCGYVASFRRSGITSSSIDVDGSVVLFHGGFLLPLFGCRKTSNDADSPRKHGGATDSAAALSIPD